MSYGHLKSTEANYFLVGLTGNSMVGALWKFLATTFTKLTCTLLVNFFMIIVMKYYINRTTTLKVKFNIVDFQIRWLEHSKCF